MSTNEGKGAVCTQDSPHVNITFVHDMPDERANDDGKEEIRVVSHRNEHELRVSSVGI
jgi:hypothetical protein